jgi:tRNA threonylcarbamoyladenosine biosynthesis protein TsaB
MMILSIETATELCGTALIHKGECIVQKSVAEKNIHSERLLVLIDEVLKQAQIEVKALDGIAVSIGPGSFTGLRIGLSAAKGLAYAQSLPLLAVPTLDSIAEEAVRMNAAKEGDVICALIDAKRDEAYYAFYTRENAVEGGAVMAQGDKISQAGAIVSGLRCQSVHSIASVRAIADEAKAFVEAHHGIGCRRVVFVGDGARKMAPIVAGMEHAAIDTAIGCSPVAVGLIAERNFAKLQTMSYLELEPAYIREFVTTMPRVANQTPIP